MEFKFLNKEEYISRINEIQGLFKVCFNRDISYEFLKWRYVDNPIEDILVCVAIEDGKIVANYSVSPILAWINNNHEKVALSMTTMTHPDFAGRGIFTELANQIYDKMNQLGYRAVLGFPNKNSHSAFIRKLQWKDIYEVPTMKLDLNNITIKNEVNLNILEDNDFLLDYEKVIKNNEINIYSNKELLTWRFKYNPMNQYKNYTIENNGEILSSVIVKEFENNEIDIVFVNSISDKSFEDIIYYLIYIYKNKDFKYINIWSSIFSPNHKVLEKIGFLNNSPITYFGARDFINSDSSIYDYSKWNINMGVSDVY